ncbi:MAG: MBL fold metallo-hydrolase [Peptococcaceae bacterium]|nr:MBL fold metallo-hydrolase [Peptococcaceae bacterium]
MVGAAMPASADEVKITAVIDNFYDGLLAPGKYAQRYGFIRPGAGEAAELPPHLSAEHGLAFYIEVSAAGEKSVLLMDFGVSREGAARNMEAMGLDLSGVKAAVLSHGHFDHWGGLEKVAARIIPGESGPIPLYAGKEAFLRRYVVLPGKRVDLGRLDPEKAGAAGFEVREISRPGEILPGVLVIGPIPRVTEFEQGSPVLMVERNGGIEQDDFPGELSLAFNVAGKGLVVLTACAHAGVVNTVRRAVELTGVEKVHAVLGGFHLSGSPDDKIKKTVAELARLGPELIAPMHCTGFQALKMISEAMPQAFVLYSAGTQYSFCGYN